MCPQPAQDDLTDAGRNVLRSADDVIVLRPDQHRRHTDRLKTRRRRWLTHRTVDLAEAGRATVCPDQYCGVCRGLRALGAWATLPESASRLSRADCIALAAVGAIRRASQRVSSAWVPAARDHRPAGAIAVTLAGLPCSGQLERDPSHRVSSPQHGHVTAVQRELGHQPCNGTRELGRSRRRIVRAVASCRSLGRSTVMTSRLCTNSGSTGSQTRRFAPTRMQQYERRPGTSTFVGNRGRGRQGACRPIRERLLQAACSCSSRAASAWQRGRRTGISGLRQPASLDVTDPPFGKPGFTQ